MLEQDAELSPSGEMELGDLGNEECEFCGRSMVSRFGGLVGTNECTSCRREFDLLNRAGKLELV